MTWTSRVAGCHQKQTPPPRRLIQVQVKARATTATMRRARHEAGARRSDRDTLERNKNLGKSPVCTNNLGVAQKILSPPTQEQFQIRVRAEVFDAIEEVIWGSCRGRAGSDLTRANLYAIRESFFLNTLVNRRRYKRTANLFNPIRKVKRNQSAVFHALQGA